MCGQSATSLFVGVDCPESSAHLIDLGAMDSTQPNVPLLPHIPVPLNSSPAIYQSPSSANAGRPSPVDYCIAFALSGQSPGFLPECRICQEEDEPQNLETPCACSGSLKFAHRSCVQHWCNEKGDTLCEICRNPYRGGYTAPQPVSIHADNVSINIAGSWDTATQQHLDPLHRQPLLFTVADHHRLADAAEYEEYAVANARSAACFRSVALMLVALLLLRHVLWITASGGGEDALTIFTFFFLRVTGFLLPCYILARAMSVLQNRREREESVMGAAEVAYFIQAGQARAMRIAISPATTFSEDETAITRR